MDDINRVAMRAVLLNNSIDTDFAQLKNMRELLHILHDQQPKVAQFKKEAEKYDYDSQDLVRIHFADYLDDEDYSEYDPFRIIKPVNRYRFEQTNRCYAADRYAANAAFDWIMWMGKDCSSFFDKLILVKENRKKFTLNLARHMWGTRVLAASKFLQSDRSLQRIYIRSRDPTGYDAFQKVMKCWYIFFELRLQPTHDLYKHETETNDFVKWHRYQMCMIMQSTRDCKRMKQIGPFDAYYYKLLSDGYKPRECWSLDSERIPKRYFQPCHQLFDIQHPISSVVYSLQPYEPSTVYVPKSPKMTKKRKLQQQLDQIIRNVC